MLNNLTIRAKRFVKDFTQKKELRSGCNVKASAVCTTCNGSGIVLYGLGDIGPCELCHPKSEYTRLYDQGI